MNFKEYTRNEFLEEHLEDCPEDVNLPMLPICENGDDEEQCKKCWENAIKGIEFKNPVEVFAQNNIQLLDELRIAEEQYKMLKEGRDSLKEQILKQMEIYGVNKFEDDKFSVSYVKGSTGSTFDSAKFKKNYPDIFKEYSKPSVRAASIRFKVK
ncbi:hypothetical protein [Terrisporobacter mayombei]|uniref:Uncharacterized protein n=1 Tax=Terrisporobacter mayombei TaxID=1541 RepID=A0ABY9PW06_9FIRM|nr:hypothetical protein [Terrisporobacter mayombei]MCC3870255.1 hypothetical protein [Terrisporobacter mayombei]WMT79880.1 hypothetical protein TEMA_01510 [Terrisporobacter mayombei]